MQKTFLSLFLLFQCHAFAQASDDADGIIAIGMSLAEIQQQVTQSPGLQADRLYYDIYEGDNRLMEWQSYRIRVSNDTTTAIACIFRENKLAEIVNLGGIANAGIAGRDTTTVMLANKFSALKKSNSGQLFYFKRYDLQHCSLLCLCYANDAYAATVPLELKDHATVSAFVHERNRLLFGNSEYRIIGIKFTHANTQ